MKACLAFLLSEPKVAPDQIEKINLPEPAIKKTGSATLIVRW